MSVTHQCPEQGRHVIGIGTGPKATGSAETIFGLCSELLDWQPFTPTAETSQLPALLRGLDTEEDGGLGASIHQVLRIREAVKILEWENWDKAQGTSREFEHRLARQHQLKPAQLCCGKAFQKSQRLCNKLDRRSIQKQLDTQCWKNEKVHSCLDPFRAAPKVIQRWRTLWYSLPKADRNRRLQDMFAQQLATHQGVHTEFLAKYTVLGQPVCRQAFMQLTGVTTDVLQAARHAVVRGEYKVTESELGMWVARRPLAYLDARSWLLEYAKSHGDSSPLSDKLILPSGRKSYYWACYYYQRMNAGVPGERIASLKRFLQAWRTELPWISVRTSAGPFTHCGLCEYLKMVAARSLDAGVRNQVLIRLGQHYDFQAAQRIAMQNIVRQSEVDPTDLLCVSWDKMDQAKTIVPRVAELANTQFMKGGARLVVSLIGVLIPALHSRPIFYTVLEDFKHGADMIGGLLVDVLLEAVGAMGVLPRRLFIQADNTAKETKNTIVLYIGLWLLSKLRHTRLESIEFGYLMVGHTHDLVDTIFSFVNKALRGSDCLSLPEMFNVLQTKMKNPPIWRHLRDIYAFQRHQPRHLTAQHVKGTRNPHHYRLFKDRHENLCVQSKRWMTSPAWSPPIVLCTSDQAAELAAITPEALNPEWEAGFQSQAISFMNKLKLLLEAGGKNAGGIEHSLGLVNHSFPEYLPSRTSLDLKLAAMRRISPMMCDAAAAQSSAETAMAAASAAFPGAAADGNDTKPLIHVIKSSSGTTAYNQDDLEDNMLVLYLNTSATTKQQVPFRLGKILRVAHENIGDPFAVVESWWPVIKPEKFGRKLNLFGTWMPSASPTSVSTGASKKQRTSYLQQQRQGMAPSEVLDSNEVVSLRDIVVWPVELEKGSFGKGAGGRIPFTALHYLRSQHRVDVSESQFTFADRGRTFHDEVQKIAVGLLPPR